MPTRQEAHIDTSRVVVHRARSPAASRGMTGSLQSQTGVGISVQAADARCRRLVTCFHATNAIIEIVANNNRQPPHEADVVRQAFHVESLPPANCFYATDIVTKMAADLPLEIAANDRMQSPHEADRGLQTFHEEGLRPAKKIGAPDIVTKMAADP